MTHETPMEEAEDIFQYISIENGTDLMRVEGNIRREVHREILKALHLHDTLVNSIRTTLEAVAKYDKHPMTASEIILRNALEAAERFK